MKERLILLEKSERPESVNGWRVLLEDEETGYKRVLMPVRFLWEHRSGYNPRKPIEKGTKFHTDLTESLDQYGQVEEMVYNLRTGNLVGGEQRTHIIYDQDPDALVPVSLVDCDEEQEVHLCIQLNRLHNEFDDAKLAEVFKTLKAGENFQKLKVTGFDKDDVAALMQRFMEDAPKPETQEKEIICPHCGHVGPAKEFETAETEAAPGKEVEA